MIHKDDRVARLSADIDRFVAANDTEAIREYLDVLDQDYGDQDENVEGAELLRRVQKLCGVT